MELIEETEVPAGTEAVYALVADFGRLADWDPNVTRSHLLSGESLTPGARYAITARSYTAIRSS